MEISISGELIRLIIHNILACIFLGMSLLCFSKCCYGYDDKNKWSYSFKNLDKTELCIGVFALFASIVCFLIFNGVVVIRIM